MSMHSSELSRPDAARAAGEDPPVVVLAAGESGRTYGRDLWRYRELALILAWRDLCVRYKQTAIGVAWALVRPLATTLILTFVFAHVAGLPSAAPYPLTALAGVWPWFLFASLLADASASLVNNAGLVTKVYFPRLLLPVAAAGVALADFLIQGAIVALVMVWYRWLPGERALLLPLFALWVAASALGPGLALAALNARYRDVRFLVPFLVQFGLYVSPVGFASEAVPAHWRFWFACNPLAGAIDGFRWCLIGGANPFPAAAPGLAVTVLLLGAGLTYFRAAERAFADII
jgi:lipopolysaccharide transport system permease protein